MAPVGFWGRHGAWCLLLPKSNLSSISTGPVLRCGRTQPDPSQLGISGEFEPTIWVTVAGFNKPFVNEFPNQVFVSISLSTT